MTADGPSAKSIGRNAVAARLSASPLRMAALVALPVLLGVVVSVKLKPPG